jgi:hypothetical protein
MAGDATLLRTLLRLRHLTQHAAFSAQFGDQAGAHAALAIARVRSGDVDGAADALKPVLALPPAMRINGVVSCVTSVHRALSAAPGSPVAAETQQAIEAFCHAPAALPQ